MADITEIIPKKAITSITTTDTAITKLDESTLKFITTVSALSEALKKGGISYKDINKAQKETVTTKTQLTKLEKEQLSAEKALQKQRDKGLAQIAKLEQKEKDLQAAINKEVKSEQDLINKTNALVAVRKRLDVSTKKGQTEHKKLTAEINRNTIALKQQDKAISRSQRNVGNYGSALKGVGSQLMGALGLTAGLYGLVRVLGSVIKTSKDFEKQTATLAGVLDVEISATKALTKQAINLGGIYPTMAKDVLNLQTAYARLGFTQQEILALTEDTIKGSFALNAELGGTAELVGAVVKSYDELNATDAGMIIDQLTKSTQKSSLSFEGLKTALPKVAGAANALNIPLNETLAALGKSIDATQDASIAGTGFRKILLSNAKAGRSYQEGLDIIESSTNKVKTATELYGDRAAVVALALTNQREETALLANEIDDSLGVATRTADKQMNTLSGSVDAVSSAWERLILKASGSEAGFLKGTMDSIASVLILLGGFTSQNPFDDMEEAIATNTILYEEALKRGNLAEAAFYKRALDSFDGYTKSKAKREEEAGFNKQISLKELLLQEETDVIKQANLLIDIENIKNKKILTNTKLTTDEKELIGLTHSQKLRDLEDMKSEEYVKRSKSNNQIQLDADNDLIEEEQEIIGDGYDAEYLANKEKNAKIEKSEQELFDQLQGIRDEGLENLLEDADAIAEAKKQNDEDELARAVQLAEAKQELLIGAADAAFSIYSSTLDRESQALQSQRENELVKVGEDKEAQKKINEKYDKLEAALKTKQAKAEKAGAIVKAALGTALAIISAYAVFPPPAGIALGLIMGALGAVQIATIAAQPIPKFFKGTDSAPDGIISVGEKGGELIHKKTGEMLYAPEQTYMSGMQGAKIYTNQETERIFNGSGSDSLEIKELTKINKRVASALENQTHYHFKTDRIIKSKGNYRRTWLNTKLAR